MQSAMKSIFVQTEWTEWQMCIQIGYSNFIVMTARLVEYQTTMREVAGPNPGRTTTEGLKITEEKVVPF